LREIALAIAFAGGAIGAAIAWGASTGRYTFYTDQGAVYIQDRSTGRVTLCRIAAPDQCQRFGVPVP
jgi:hypothetical protein